MMKEKNPSIDELFEFTHRKLATLMPREEEILKMKYGLQKRRTFSDDEIAKHFDLSKKYVQEIQRKSLRKLREPSASLVKRLGELTQKYLKEISPPIEVKLVIEQANSLSIELIKHLKENNNDIDKIKWNVFEHLVAEFLASQGFQDVRLVGRDSNTSADVYAVHTIDSIGAKIRFFIEVKREKNSVGINVINSICGAISLEKEKHGWHAGIIVSISGFKNFKKHPVTELSLKGIEMKGRQDLLIWLENYKPNKDGLWLPNPKKKMPSS